MTRPIIALVTLALAAFGPGSLASSAAPAGAPLQDGTSVTQDQARAEQRGPLVARVNGVPIYKIDFDHAMENFVKSQGLSGKLSEAQSRQVREVVLDGLIGSELLHQKAQSIPIEVGSAEIEQTIAQTRESLGEERFQEELRRRSMTETDLRHLVRQNLMVQKLIQDLILPRVDVSEEEIRAFYEEHQSDMKKPERVEASHILVKSSPSDSAEKKAEARRRIEEAARRVRSGEDFAVLAKQYSDDGTASQGGQLGNIQRGQTVPSFEEAAFRLHAGEVSEVVESPYGYHLIKVTNRTDPAPATLDEAHDTIAQFLKQKKAQDAVEQMVQELRTGARVEML
jgi:peptidyl-prolyl cis-trans isomerase C